MHIPHRLKDIVNPITEIHIEHVEVTCTILIKWAKKNENAMLMFMPRELSYVKCVLSTVQNPVGLHVHFRDDLKLRYPLPLPSLCGQYEAIKKGVDFFRDLGVEICDFTSGRWNYDYNTFKACRQFGLTKVHLRCIHIPKLTCGIPEGIQLIPVHKHLHDWSLDKKWHKDWMSQVKMNVRPNHGILVP